MIDWSKIQKFHDYLEQANYELNSKICKTQNEILRLQKIVDSFNPKILKEEPDPVIIKQQKVFRGINKPSQQQANFSENLYAEFQRNLYDYEKLPKYSRDRISNGFIKRMMDFCRFTPAHLHQRMIQGCDVLIEEFNNPDPARSEYLISQSEEVLFKFESLVKENSLFKRVEVQRREIMEELNQISKIPLSEEPEDFETIGNLTLKQLYEIYKMRGVARQAKVTTNVLTHTGDTFISFLEENINMDLGDQEKQYLIQAATRCYQILAESPRKIAIVSIDEN